MGGERCLECGATLGSASDCNELFERLLAREFGDFRYAREHRLSVDAYSLQHPDRYMRSAKSFVAHLTGAWAALESERVETVNHAIQGWLSRPRSLVRPDPPPPGDRGSLTVTHPLAASEPAAHLRRVREWAASAWEAWSRWHPLAERWVAEATAGRQTRG